MFIIDHKPRLSDLASVWMAGVAVVVSITGLIGLAKPLNQNIPIIFPPDHQADGVMIESFEPAPLPDAQTQPDQSASSDTLDSEIPPLPEIVPPLEAPAMIDITPIDAPAPPTPQMPATKPPPLEQRTTSRIRSQGRPTNLVPSQTATGVPSSSNPNTTRGSNPGRFPPPAYPSSARSRREQGTVKLLVTVEPSGLPSAIIIDVSSGSATLDNAAKDHVSRRWRWPASQSVRRIVVPVRFQLE